VAHSVGIGHGTSQREQLRGYGESMLSIGVSGKYALSESEKSRRLAIRQQNDQRIRATFDPLFEPLGFKVPEGRIPSNKYGMRKLVPTTPFGILVCGIIESGEHSVDNVCELTGVHHRRLHSIRHNEARYLELDIADALLVGLGRTHLWHLDFAPVYDFAFHGCMNIDC
jgi:hypothetical protein